MQFLSGQVPLLILRPTGTSVMVGLIDLPPSEVDVYTNYLTAAMKRWGKLAQRKHRETDTIKSDRCINIKSDRCINTKSNVADFNNACGFVGIGPWNFLSLTLVSEKGLATELAFLGHSRGQSYTFAHDYSLALDLREQDPGEEAYFTQVNTFVAMMRTTGLTHLLGISNKNDGNPDSDGDAWRHKLDLNPAEKTDIYTRTVGRQKHNFTFHAHLQPLTLEHIYSGKDSIYGLLTKPTEPAATDADPAAADAEAAAADAEPAAADAEAAAADAESAAAEAEPSPKGHSRLPGENELLMLYQMKFNPLLKIRNYAHLKKLAYLAVVKLFHDYLLDFCEPEKNQPISFVRPFISDGFFDFSVIIRGTCIPTADRLMLKFKQLTVKGLSELLKDKLDLLVKEELKCWGPEADDVSLFKLTHTTSGVPCTLLKNAEQDIVKNPDWTTEKKYKEYLKGLEKYLNQDDEDFGVSTMVSAKVDQLHEAQKVAEEIHALVRNENDTCPLLTKTQNKRTLLNGRYDLELFSACRQLSLKHYIAALQVFKIQLNYPKEKMKPFHARAASIILTLKSKLGVPTAHPQSPSSLEAEQKFFNPDADCTFFSKANLGMIFRDLDSSIKASSSLKEYPEVEDRITTAINWWTNHTSEYIENYKLQYYFSDFLTEHLSDYVSSETLEMVNTVFCSIDRFLVDPLSFSFYLDVLKYLNYFFKVILSLTEVKDLKTEVKDSEATETAGGFYRFDPEGLRVEKKPAPSSKSLIGMEAYLSDFCDFAQRAFSQRQFGDFPNHDRSMSRLIDLKVAHSKKLKSCSWMIDNFFTEVQNWLFAEIDHMLKDAKNQLISNKNLRHYKITLTFWHIKEKTKDSGPQKKIRMRPVRTKKHKKFNKSSNQPLALRRAKSNLIKTLLSWKSKDRIKQTFLPYFTSSPELSLDGKLNGVSLNARHLSSFESLILVTHEMGHVFDNFLKDTIGPQKVLTLKRSTTSSQGRLNEHLTELLGARFAASPFPESNGSNRIFTEARCDLMVFRTCFSPLSGVIDSPAVNKIYHPEFPRVQHLPLGLEHDIIDDFFLSMTFQFTLLAKIRTSAIEELWDRLCLGHTILKYFHYFDSSNLVFDDTGPKEAYSTLWAAFWLDQKATHLMPELTKDSFEIHKSEFTQFSLKEQWQSFTNNKLPYLIERLSSCEDSPLKSRHRETYGAENKNMLDPSKIPSPQGRSDRYNRIINSAYKLITKPLEGSFEYFFLKALAKPHNAIHVKHAYVKPVALQKVQDLFCWVNGIKPSTLDLNKPEEHQIKELFPWLEELEASPHDPNKPKKFEVKDLFSWPLYRKSSTFNLVKPEVCYATVLQLCGLINLGFSQNLRKPKDLQEDASNETETSPAHQCLESKFPKDYPGYLYHQEQQQLGRVRRLVNGILHQGALHSVNRDLTRRGFWNDLTES
ncbi:hypothetical protein [Acanthopleuribacter pedis]|uniref:Uncharacterized protein n=1 Tax=Acanthopleuribacter pedis TaxID=442870 RepID=A0A8J7U637_9BACT|nr:hypothetical protein [Acanthopleuribacter pedis]MBO1323208.1 hypothetical protein [Acanthopleuribacter pedis]